MFLLFVQLVEVGVELSEFSSRQCFATTAPGTAAIYTIV